MPSQDSSWDSSQESRQDSGPDPVFRNPRHVFDVVKQNRKNYFFFSSQVHLLNILKHENEIARETFCDSSCRQ